MKRLLFFATAIVMTAATWAQMPNLEPSTELKQMSWMIGEWTGSANFTMPDMPEMTMTITYKGEWDGQFLKQTAVNDFGVFQMTESLFLGWDPMKKEFFSHSFSNLAPTPRIDHGQLKDNVLSMTSEPWGTQEQPPMTSRSIITKIDDDSHSMKLEFMIEEKWVTVTTITFKRKK